MKNKITFNNFSCTNIFRFLPDYISTVAIPWFGYYTLAFTGSAKLVSVSYENFIIKYERIFLMGLSGPEWFSIPMKLFFFRNLMVITYISFYFFLLGAPVYLLVTGMNKTFKYLRLHLAIAGIIGYTLYFIFPTRSPYYVFELYNRSEFAFSQRLVHQAVNIKVAFLYDAFPSMHIAFAIIITMALSSISHMKMKILIWTWFILLCISTMATGAHYAIDIFAGIFLALTINVMQKIARF